MTSELPPVQREWEREHFPQPTGERRLAAVVEQAKDEIVEDVRAGRVPVDVETFADLHDHVDANCYGGLCDEGDTTGRFGWNDDGTPNCDEANALDNALDEWIRSGGLREALAVPR
jgi:hypothetical protein